MKEQTIGDILRESRVAQHLTLEEVEEKTSISSSYLLALELEQFQLIPENQIEDFIQKYGECVHLDTADLLAKYRKQRAAKPVKEDKKAPAPKQAAPTSKAVPYKTETPTSTQRVSQNVRTDDMVVGSRSSRHKNEEVTASYIPIILLSLVALGILAFVSLVTWNQLQSDRRTANTDYSVFYCKSSTSSSSSSESTSTSTSSSSSDNKLKMTTEGGGSNLTVNLSNVPDTVTVDISLSGADSSWVSVTNSASGDSGVLLSSTGTTSYSATLASGTKSSVITLGVTKGVTVTINGQKVDTSAITSTTLSYITLNIQ
ncbi:RodZ domain-containing protein [uncultured Streptococcus sp.]|uniref:helix-turn-helix domain-containing protein n=1 Tax=uncultured Streptococcus sp. TaxID=83427 RepID=UPI0025E82BA1|nr:RodZ domain-containing protein [uncultured Streptococcus sp.]